MSEWKKVKLGEVCDTQYGFTASTVQQDTGTQFLRITDIVPQLIDWNTVPYCQIQEKDREKYLLHKGDIVVARTGATVGYAKYIKEDVPAVFASYLVRLLVNSIDVDRHYVGLCVESNLFKEYIQSISNGSAQPNANAQMISSFEINLPPLSTQHRIATILSRYDSLIENYQKQIKLLEEAARRLYKEWFIDLRFPGHENTKIVDGLPEGWEKKKVKEVCDTTSGGTPSRSKTEFYTGDILWVKTKELNDDFIFDTEEKITEDAIRNSSAKMVPSGSILMAMYGATIGKLGIATKELSCNQACCVFLLPEDSTLRLYLYNWLLNSRTLLISMGKGAAQPNLSQDMIKNLEVVVPSSCLLAKFDSKVKPLYRIMSYHSSQLRLLTEARDRLLPKLMSGEITV
ncbi:MAG: restriction endonuclease subunit S [Bacteroidales bacterium]|nr:restriction endonuclease subunit S [Bacteroidales bacterium]MDY5737762.1 restriction endonuclease subunit S [Candidatus Onthomorpha sp.]